MDHTPELSTENEVKGRPVGTPLTPTPIPARTLAVSAQLPGMLPGLSVVFVVLLPPSPPARAATIPGFPVGSKALSCFFNLHGEVLGSRQERTAEKGSTTGLELAN